VLVLLLGLLVLAGVIAERRRVAWVAHTTRVQLALERTISEMRAAEARQREYVLTGDTSLLVPYATSIANAKLHAAEVRRLTSDNPIQLSRIDEIDALIDRRAAPLRGSFDLLASGLRDSAIAHIRFGSGRIVMDSLLSSVAVMSATEDRLLLRRADDMTLNERTTVMIVIVGSIVAAALSLLLNMMFRSFAKEQQRNAELLQEQAAELEMQRDELQKQSAQLATRTEAAEQANRAKTDFLRAMSHELRTPLNAIGGYAQLMELGIRGPVTEEQHEDLSRIRRSQQHLLSLINDILNFAKLEAGHVHFEMQDVPLHEVILAMDELIRPQMLAKQITYECDAGALNTVVRADREKVLQIMLNLLSNAVKFTPANGTISVFVSRAEGMACVNVRDNGVGIPADRQEAVFEPFVQVGRSLSWPAEGTGLGLAISRDLARSMGGDLTVTSEAGQGSTFTLCLAMTRSPTS
jgi:signal transduction histidine kinase